MELRNLTRVFVFKRSLSKYNKGSDIKLKGIEVYILLSIYYDSGLSGCSVLSIQAYMKPFRYYDASLINGVCKKFASLGVLNNNAGKYWLSVTGRNVLNSLEKTLRNTRYDR